jgi:hypothetical protein
MAGVMGTLSFRRRLCFRLPTETAWTHSTVFICYYSIGATLIVRPPAQPNSNMLPLLTGSPQAVHSQVNVQSAVIHIMIFAT